MEERVLYPGRARLILLMIGCLLGMFAGGLTFFGLICAACACFFAASLLPNGSWLKLNQTGFTFKMWFRVTTYRWSDIESFVLITRRYWGVIPISRSAGFRFSASYRKPNVARKFVRALVGWDGQLPDNYGLKAKVLVELLSTYRLQALAAATAMATPGLESSTTTAPVTPSFATANVGNPSPAAAANGQVTLNGELVKLSKDRGW
jgi:hypothetical protein